jgi:hypothetical protein
MSNARNLANLLTPTTAGTIPTDLVMSGTTPTLTIGDAGAEDTKIVFDGNAQDFHIGLDDSVDDLVIGKGSALGTTPAIAITEDLLVTTHGGITMAGATPTLTIGDAGAEDAKIVFDGNAQDFHIGLDDSADDLVIGKGSALGTTPALSIDENLIITQVTSMVKPIVTLVATDAITIAEHAGRTLLMGEVGGNAAATFTLPAATGSGAEYRFIVSVINTSNYVIQVANANDTIDGSVILHQDSANTTQTFNTVAASDTITLNGTTKGGVSIGDEITLLDMATNQYMVKGVLTASGTEATPFSAAVS